MGSMEALWASSPLPQRRGQPCSWRPTALGERARGMAVHAVTHGLRVGRCAPRVGCGEGGRGQRCPLMALKPRNPWHPTAFYRPRGKKAEALPQSLPSTPAPRAQTEGTPGAPPQRARLPEAMEPPSREASLLHSVNNQISQDGELRTDSWSVTSTYTCGPRRLPRDRWDATGPGTAGLIASLTCSQPHLSQSPEREESSRQDVSRSGWEVTCGQ